MELVAVGIAVAGWLASHLLAIRAQRQNFINQIKNDARKQIGEALKEYEDWCATVSTRLWGLRVPFLEGVPPWPEERWVQVGREFLDLFWSAATLRYQFAIEENEILFPELRRPRQQLSDWHAAISTGLSSFLTTIWTATARQQGVEEVQSIANRISELRVLASYLHVYVQNLALAPIVGRAQPVPRPRDVTLVRLIATGSKLEFGLGKPLSRAAFAWRRIRHGRIQAILEDNLPSQQALFRRMREAAEGHPLPVADFWVQGEGTRMAVQVLDAHSGRGLWLEVGSADEILSKFVSWMRSAQVPCAPGTKAVVPSGEPPRQP